MIVEASMQERWPPRLSIISIRIASPTCVGPPSLERKRIRMVSRKPHELHDLRDFFVPRSLAA